MTNTAKFLYFIVILLSPVFFFGQQVQVNTQSKPLNEVLAEISTQYGIQISFDDRDLSQYKIKFTGTYKSPEEAIRKMIENLPLDMIKTGDVIIIVHKQTPTKPKTYTISGQILEQGTMEPLPYSNILVNGNGMIADLKGSFSYVSNNDSTFRIRASHLGYYVLDTSVSESTDLRFLLTPSVIGLTEVIIKNSVIERSTLAGDKAGMMKLNHQVANFLPGFGDNSVFNLLRLQPGILASGEQTNELIIWGCYEGQSKVIFDGFTIFGLKNFNDNISAFNPLMAKDIEVYKGGYDARFGERTGGIVNITGKNGNSEDVSFSVDINNMTMNGMVEIPMFKNGSLIIALRHTYYELYNPGDVNSLFGNKVNRDSSNAIDVNIVPDYRFRDLNIKYSSRIKNRDLFYISLYAGNDRFSYSIDQALNNHVILKNTAEFNSQSGGSIYYGKSWKNGYNTDFSLNYSRLKANYSDDLSIEKIHQQITEQVKDMDAENIAMESTVQVNNRFPVHKAHILEGGMVITGNRIELREDTFNIPQAGIDNEARRITMYFQDVITLRKILEVKAGLRITQAFNLQHFYPEPRISASVKIGDSFKVNAAWGIYNQFITKASVLDDMGNYRYIWTVCDNDQIPVLQSFHYVAGTSFNKYDFTVNLEGYYKDITGLTRYIRNTVQGIEGIYEGFGRSYGMDVLIKKDYKGHSAWVAYSLSKTEEIFEYFKVDEYRRAPQDQRHEVKLAALVNLDPVYFSADYVFGSGFPSSPEILAEDPDNLTYSRLDVAVIYKFLDRRMKGEIGLSVLNVLNTQNIKYANFERLTANQTNSINIYSEAIPITPALYFKLSM